MLDSQGFKASRHGVIEYMIYALVTCPVHGHLPMAT
jgi:hypothetical protein